ncbi:MAG TPA: GNAT family N-acetyltransferase [Puia sp.]|jgi:ribosomal protein S18 acetylase RimI-like enzyme|nr:GNAT family N-acetyltransferase [Puia sp.]
MTKITKAHTTEHFQSMEAFGRWVVPETYAPYFPREWADYLVDAGHTVIALEGQAAEGYRHYRVEVDGVLAGYFALHERADGRMVLTHLYLRPDLRGRGLGREVMEFVDREAVAVGVPAVELVVLRKNAAAVKFYKRHGYEIEREILTPIGPGAELEDYLMTKIF